MTTVIVEVPDLVNPGIFPTPSGDSAAYNRASRAWADQQQPFANSLVEIAESAHANSLATAELAHVATQKAQEAGQSAQSAADDAQRLVTLDALWLGALAADPATGRNGAPLVAGNAYVNTATGYIRAYTGAAWVQGVSAVAGVTSLNGQLGDLALKTVAGQSLLGVGDIGFVNSYGVGEFYTGLFPPDTGQWIEAGNLYLKSSYPALAAAMPNSHIPIVWSPAVVSEIQIPGLLFSLASLGPLVVAVPYTTNGAAETLRVSRDFGKTWSHVVWPGSYASGAHAAFDSETGRFYTAGVNSVDSGMLTLAYTDDFVDWTVKTSAANVGGAPASIAASGGIVIVAGPFATTTRYAVSTNSGESWTLGNMPGAAATWIVKPTAPGKFVALPNSSGGANRAATYDGGAWTARTTVASAIASDVATQGLSVFAPQSGAAGGALVSSDGGITWSQTAAITTIGKAASTGTAQAVLSTAPSAQVRVPESQTPLVSGSIPFSTVSPSTVYYKAAGHDGVFLFVGRSASSSNYAVIHIDTYGYDRSTQFYVPKNTTTGAFKQWVRAGDFA